MRYATALVALAPVLLGAGCRTCPTDDYSFRREFVGTGQVTQGGTPAAACTGTGGRAVACDDGATDCCRWDLATSLCRVEAVDDFRPADDELPTWVRVRCPSADVLFALPDLRRAAPGTRALAAPIGPWQPDEEPGDVGVAGACARGTCYQGQELRLSLDVVERSGGPASGAYLASDDFRADVVVTGAVSPGDPAAPLAFEVRVIQTPEHYRRFVGGCE
jgi:hypothetical protein